MDVDYGLKINFSRREIRILLFHEFHLGSKAIEATNNICSTMSKDACSIRTAQHWFSRFKNSNLEFDNLRPYVRLLELDVELLKQLIEEDPRLTSRYLAGQLGCSHATMEKHLNELGKIWSLDIA